MESDTFYGAVAKGSAAGELLSDNQAQSAIDECKLIYDIDQPASQLSDPWPVLPEAARVASNKGEQLLEAIRERMKEPRSTTEGKHKISVYLFDESGDSIQAEVVLDALLDDAGDNTWLVPAMALKDISQTQAASQKGSGAGSTTRLRCQHDCERSTPHRFTSYEAIPSDDVPDQPIWECQECGGPRYGPDP